MLAWGIRMTFSVLAPLLYGVLTRDSEAAMWIIVSAESICWVELKGSFAQRVRLLLGGALLSVLFGLAGSLTAGSLWLSLLCMLVVVFIASLFKNLGERGSGLSLTVYVMFIVANAYHPESMSDVWMRCVYIAAGALWTLFVGVVASLFISEQTPFKRSIAFIWKSTAALADTIDQGWDGKGPKASLRDIYLKQKEINASIDSSLQLYENRAYHLNHESVQAHEMAKLRKTAYLTGAALMAIAQQLEHTRMSSLSGEVRQSIHAILKSVAVICERMTVYTVNSKPEEEVLLRSRIIRLQNMIALVRESEIPLGEQRSVKYVLHYTGRIVRLVEEAIAHVKAVEGDPKVYRSYSLMKTLLILHHRHWTDSIRRLANINTHSFRYAIRTALVATLSLFIYKFFEINHGYWLPFTVMIVAQPYFGATLKKALDRVLGTVSGVVIGGLLLAIPGTFPMKELLLLVSPLLMVYFLRKQYGVATFFISIFLVALFAAEHNLDNSVILTRALCTVGGAALAVIGEFALLPTWDKDWLPRHITEAIHASYNYFLFTFLPNNFSSLHQWTHYRRLAESANSNAFDSFNRYLAEPTTKEKDVTIYYQLISHCIRVVRELNNYHLEADATPAPMAPADFEEPRMRIAECRDQFAAIVSLVTEMGIRIENDKKSVSIEDDRVSLIPMNAEQRIYVDKIAVELNAFHRDMARWKSESAVS